MPFDPQSEGEFTGRLLEDERLLWIGAPAQGLLLSRRDWILIPFSLLWGGFSIFWEAMVLRLGAPWFMALFGVPFVLIGLFLIAGRFFVDARIRRDTAYALTDQRVLIDRRGRFPSFKAVRLDRLPEADLSEAAMGRGTIRFGQQAPLFARGGGGGASVWIASLDPVPQFVAIDEARAVFDLVQNLYRRSDRGPWSGYVPKF